MKKAISMLLVMMMIGMLGATTVVNAESTGAITEEVLQELITEAETLGGDKYSRNSYNELTVQIANAKEVAEKADSSLEEYETAYNQLKHAITVLRPRVNVVPYYKAITSNDTGNRSGTNDLKRLADGNAGNSSYWESTGNPAISDLEVTIELDGYYDLEEIVVVPYVQAGRSYFYDVYISEDGVEWTLVAEHTQTGTYSSGNSHPISEDVEVNTRYIKLDCTGKINRPEHTNQKLHLNEVLAYGEEVGNIILGKAYTSSGDDLAWDAAATTDKAVDSSRSTYWDGGAYANKPWLDVDLGDIYSLDRVNVVTYVASGRHYQYEVYASTDGESYVKIAEKKDKVEPTIHGTTFEFDEPVYASHLKVVGTYNSKNSAFHVAEFRAYGDVVTDEGFIDVIARQEIELFINNTINSIYRSDYTESSWELYAKVRSEALALIDDENSTIEELQEIRSELQKAVELLETGNPDEKEEGTFRVASFNIWAPNPKHPNVEAILEQLLRCEVDYAGIQEVDKNNTRDNRDVLKLIADDDYYYNYKKTINYKNGEYGIGQLSLKEILEVSGENYTKTASEEGRAWMRMLVEIDGKEVAIYNTHISLINSSYPNAQSSNMAEILKIMEADTCKYKILTADFNATRDAMNPFKEDYNLVNGNDGLWYSTFDGDSYSSGLGYLDGEPDEDITSGIDNIVYSRNIEASNVRVVYSDLSDHYMLYADFKLLAYEEELQELVDSLNYTEEYYTDESWASYCQELEEAKVLLENTDYTELQDELKAAITELQEAIAGLKESVFEIVTQPIDTSAVKGEDATVFVKASGQGLAYKWYYKNPGNVKFYESGSQFVSEDGAAYTIPMYAWRDGQEVYCVITDANGESIQSNTVTLTVDTGSIRIIKQPESAAVDTVGGEAVVTVEATGTGLTYQWYYKNPGNKKFYLSGEQFVSEDGAAYTIPVAAWRDGQQVYCVITDVSGISVQTNTVTLSVAK